MIEPITTAVQEITIDSNRILHHTEADLIDRRISKVIRLVQYDLTLPVIAVALKSGGVVYSLPSGAACNIRIRKPDDTIVYNPAIGCDSTRSVVYFEVTAQVGAVVGELQTVVEVILAGKTAGTSPLRIVVEDNPIKIDDYESMDEMQTITALVSEAEDARDAAESAAQTAAQDAVREIAAETFKSIASYEATTTASQPYSVGDYLGYDGKLYKVTALIAQGGTIVTTGTNANVEQTTAGDQITDVQGDISDIQGDVSDIQGDISDIQGDISDIQGDISNIEVKRAQVYSGSVSVPTTSTEVVFSLPEDFHMSFGAVLQKSWPLGTWDPHACVSIREDLTMNSTPTGRVRLSSTSTQNYTIVIMLIYV